MTANVNAIGNVLDIPWEIPWKGTILPIAKETIVNTKEVEPLQSPATVFDPQQNFSVEMIITQAIKTNLGMLPYLLQGRVSLPIVSAGSVRGTWLFLGMPPEINNINGYGWYEDFNRTRYVVNGDILNIYLNLWLRYENIARINNRPIPLGLSTNS